MIGLVSFLSWPVIGLLAGTYEKTSLPLRGPQGTVSLWEELDFN